jgi:phosphatidylethanolamine/phosphatidyl-N-methylethanolamine N-methyltransferase
MSLPSETEPARLGLIHEWKAMLSAFRKDFFHTGSVMPSSRFLGWELAAPLRSERPPCRILEIGPGTGPVTQQILKCLRPGDQFDAVEINGDFVKVLCRRFQQQAPCPSESEPKEFRILHSPIQTLAGEKCYQHVISGLPFNNFPARLVRDIWKSIHRLTAPGGTFSFFEYVAVREMKMPFVAKEEKRRLALVGRHLCREIKQFQTKAKKVWCNVPPAVVHHLQF